jgi:hypothetical protein
VPSTALLKISAPAPTRLLAQAADDHGAGPLLAGATGIGGLGSQRSNWQISPGR